MSNASLLYRFKAQNTDEANTARAYRVRYSADLLALSAASQMIGADADECASLLSSDAQSRASRVLWQSGDADAVLLSSEAQS